ncbi:MAG: M23 family metallopeptidase [Clostridia bacterium]|nr:M23 family metallopeptidase [Clostridia bacterium]
MRSEKKSNKRRVALRYIILAAIILVIAAVTVTVVFAANDWFRSDITIDKGDSPLPPVVDPDPDKDKDKPTLNDTTFLKPVNDLNVTTVFEFFQNESLNGKWYFHTGIDLTAPAGTAVVSSLDGTVESIVRDEKCGETTVTIAHDNGVKTVYSYIDVVEGLKKGSKVKRGEKIGTVSEIAGSEYKMGPHLHFEVIENGKPKDPADFLEITEK